MTAPKNAVPLGLPMTISLGEALQNIHHGAQRKRRVAVNLAVLTPADRGDAPVDLRGSTDKSATAQAQLRASYAVGDTTASPIRLDSPDVAGPILLEVTDIDGYDRNPRQFRNDSEADIRHSIESNGFQDALVVTRRQRGDRFMLAAGSNTTLNVLKELYKTTGADKYRWVNCIFQPYQDEPKLLAQHLAENLNRGDMRFWEIALGMTELITMINDARGQAQTGSTKFSVRDAAEALTSRGLKVSKSGVALWTFAAQRLGDLGPATAALSYHATRDEVQPRLHALRALADRFGVAEGEYWGRIVKPTLEQYGQAYDPACPGSFDHSAACDRVQAAFADAVNETVADVRQMLATLKLAPDRTLAELRQPSPNLIVAPRREAPLANSLQAPLPIPPAAVRLNGQPVETRAAHISSGPAAIQRGGGLHPQRPEAPTAARPPGDDGPLFSQGVCAADLAAAAAPLFGVHRAVRDLLGVAGLIDVWRAHEPMPLGFYVELPDPSTHPRRTVALDSPDYHVRRVKTMVWWSLVALSGQLRDGSSAFMDPQAAFFKYHASGDTNNPLDGTDIDGEPPEIDAMVIARVAPGLMNQAMGALRIVESRVAELFEQMPQRWQAMLEVHRPTV
jgi:ParB family protein of integrating conjugative element (PFGI_1 class)